MRGILVLAAVLAGGVAAQARYYHAPQYILGGYSTTSSFYWTGLWLADPQKQTVTSLTANLLLYRCLSAQMDVNNRDILLGLQGTISSTYSPYLRSGLYRFDPVLQQVTTILANTMTLYNVQHVHVNQDGNYVFTCQQRRLVGTRIVYDWNLFQVDQSGNLTTLLSTARIGGSGWFYEVGVDMDTGNYLLNAYVAAKNLRYAVLEVALDGSSWSTFGGGGAFSSYGWYGYYESMEQNLDTGAIQGQTYSYLYELKRGAASRTTLYKLGYPGAFIMGYTSKFDTQSAPRKRLVATGYEYKMKNNTLYYPPAVFYIDMKPPYVVTALNVDPRQTTGRRYHYSYVFDFYRGRHLQTVKAAPGKWQILLSCPRFPGKPYVLAVGAGGYRPGLGLPDGRRIHLNLDTVALLAAQRLLWPYFDPGPGVLDAQGTALGMLDVARLKVPLPLGVPVWIAAVVLDPQAPLGVAYIPDPIVLRL